VIPGHGGARILVPANAVDEAAFEKLRMNTEYKCDLRKARNPDHHRKGFALINLIFDSQEKYLTMEDMLTELKLMVGWYREHVRSNGDLVYLPKSISFADMDQLEFETFYDRVLDLAIGPRFNLGKPAIEFLGEDYDGRKAKASAARSGEPGSSEAV
jgi:hypothetical protein